MKLVIFLFSLIALSSCWGGEVLEDMYSKPLFDSPKGIVSFSGYEPLKNKPVRIHYSIPAGDVSDMPIMFILPGINRNANEYIEAGINALGNKKVMLFSLEFPKDLYSNEEYNEGGVMHNNTLKNESEWSFSIIEPIFEFIKKETGNSTKSFDMWGHSAGAQFVHRFALLKPLAPANRLVSANAGWYTVPDIDIDFPYGLKNTGISEQKYSKAFSNKLIVQLGTADTDENDPNLNHSDGAELQGKNRYERGSHFWRRSQEIAGLSSFQINWEKTEVVGVAHEYKQMVTNAFEILY